MNQPSVQGGAEQCQKYALSLAENVDTYATVFINFEDPAENVEVILNGTDYKHLRLVVFFQNNFKGAVEEFHLFSMLATSPVETFITTKFSVHKNRAICRSMSFPAEISSSGLVLSFNILKPNDFDPKSVEFLKTKVIKLQL